MNIYVYENDETSNMSPLSSNRATFDIRIGSETFLDRIKRIFPDDSISLFVRDEFRNNKMMEILIDIHMCPKLLIDRYHIPKDEYTMICIKIESKETTRLFFFLKKLYFK